MGGNNLNLDRVVRLLDLMSRVIRTCQVYPKGHDLKNTFLIKLYEEISSFLETEGRFECYIEDLSVCDFMGRELFRGEKENLFPWGLYKNGIRGLVFYKGLTFEELKRFVSLLVEKTDDLLYYLLESDMPHVSFDIAEYVVMGYEEIKPYMNGWKEVGVSFDFGEDIASALPSLYQDLSLTKEELAYLKEELKETGKDYFSSYLGVILDIFSMEEYSDIAEDLLQSLRMLALESLGWGDLYLSLSLVKRLKGFLNREDLDDARKRQVSAVLDKMRSPEVLDLIRRNYSPKWGDDSLLDFLIALDFPTVDPILQWLEGEERKGARRALVGFLAEKAKSSPGLMVYSFNRGGPRVQVEVVRLAGRFWGDEGKRVLSMALDSQWENVRKEALKVSLKVDPSSLEILVSRFLDTADSHLRTVLFDAVLELGGVPSVAPLLALEASKEDFIHRSYLEKRLYFYALFLSDLNLFEEVLNAITFLSPGWRSRKKWEETLEIALNVALDSGRVALTKLEELIARSGNRRAWKVWEKVVRFKERAR